MRRLIIMVAVLVVAFFGYKMIETNTGFGNFQTERLLEDTPEAGAGASD